jgi:hypothetical protein
MEAICSSETSVVTQQTTRRHISEDDTLHMMMQFEVTGREHLIADEVTLWKIASVVATALFQYNLNLKSTVYLVLRRTRPFVTSKHFVR